MTDYSKLVEALRCENTGDDECGSSDCPYWSGLGCMDGQLMEDAAAAIEELQDKVFELEEELNDGDVAADDNAWQIEELQAEVKRLELDNEDYEHEHRRLKGEIEALQAQLPKRGEVVRCGECKHRKDSIQCPLCSEGIETADDWFCADGEREVQE